MSRQRCAAAPWRQQDCHEMASPVEERARQAVHEGLIRDMVPSRLAVQGQGQALPPEDVELHHAAIPGGYHPPSSHRYFPPLQRSPNARWSLNPASKVLEKTGSRRNAG